MGWWGRQRAEQIGTFGVSVTAGFGAATLMVLSPCTTTLHYGLFESDGSLPMRLTFDHRVIDGATAARALVELESALLGEILAELRTMAHAAA
jgi:pyruvate/2-oxoglutarate dehydrogenase complex dihydrolipoamide acyltransferase (E2) component